MKLVSYNIQYGFGEDGRYELARAAKVVAGADIIALQEVERFWERTNEDDQPAILSSLLPDFYWVYGPAFDMDASKRGKDGQIVNRRRQFGTMLLSRYPIAWSRLHLLPMRKMLHPLNTQNPALEGLVQTPGGPLRILSLHLAHVGSEERMEQLEFLLARHRRVGLEGGPWSGRDDETHRNWTNCEPEPDCPTAAIWMGDFNSEPGSPEYERVTGNNPYHPGASYVGGFVDSAVATGQNPSTFTSHEGKDAEGRLRKRRLDYCFVSAELVGNVRSMWIDEAETASDHKPVWTEIDLT
ncbi:endonuclease/exonuclease/phosphatase family protein [Limibacillus halophilus]|uniref:Endonuclease/exonuclease/phosphatase family metal-dependent hydrolase n=1 Tax=Limibacillus halophilus TaxID=1579333 RepID=A0A839SVI7_9PROT|nr:endonuclease/exonuclease/phosphatase family protein [Limibacillus halophilus]MBB3066821.1 endonuclease/exonuclease/phosphatase family metal-dependent hydrolase [Limibacillus halophilus]